MNHKVNITLKKILSIFLVAVTVIGTAQFTMFEAGADLTYHISGDWYYTLDSETSEAYITYYSGSSASVTVPATLDGNKVTALGMEIFADATEVKSITVSSGITRISENCFVGCYSLESVTIPNTVTYMGLAAFSYCSNLKKVSIGSGVTEIPNSLFMNCTSLADVSFGGKITSIGNYAFYKCVSLDSFSISSTVASIGASAFEGCSSLNGISIPKNTATIGAYAFKDCTSLSDFTVSGTAHSFGVDSLFNTAVYNDSSNWSEGNFVVSGSLLSVSDSDVINVPEGVVMIADGAFLGKTVKTINLPSTFVSMNENTFMGATSLENINVASGNSTFSSSNGALVRKSDMTLVLYPAGKSSTSYAVGSTIKKISSAAFRGNLKIQKITLPSSLVEIEANAFENCSNLAEVSFASGLKKIGDYAFSGTAIKSATLPSTVTDMGDFIFYMCKSLESAVISEGITTISSGAFSGCTNLKVVTMGSKVQSIMTFAFKDCSSLFGITFSSGLKYIGSNAFENCTSIKNVEIKANVDSFAFSGCTGLTTLVMKDGTEYLETAAFKGCTSLSKVEIPSTLKKIMSECFLECSSLKAITIPKTVEVMGTNVFSASSTLVISGYSGSSAHTYASNNGITFKAINVQSPGPIRINSPKKVIYLDALKVSASHFSEYLVSSGTCNKCTVTQKNGSAIGSGKYVGTSCIVKIDNVQYSLVIKGDTSGDGQISTSDYLQIKKTFLRQFQFDDITFLAADVDGNGKIDSTDYIRLKLHFLGEYKIFG